MCLSSLSSVSSTLPTGQLSNVPWRRTGVKYTSNEIFLDLIEEVDAIIDKSVSNISNINPTLHLLSIPNTGHNSGCGDPREGKPLSELTVMYSYLLFSVVCVCMCMCVCVCVCVRVCLRFFQVECNCRLSGMPGLFVCVFVFWLH